LIASLTLDGYEEELQKQYKADFRQGGARLTARRRKKTWIWRRWRAKFFFGRWQVGKRPRAPLK